MYALYFNRTNYHCHYWTDIVIIITIIIIIIILSLEYESWYLIIRICKRLYALYRFVWLEWRGESLTRVIRDTYYAVPLAGGFLSNLIYRSRRSLRPRNTR